MKYLLSIIFSVLTICFITSCTSVTDKEECHTILSQDIEPSIIKVSSIIEDLELIPLEDKLDCMVNQPTKLIATQNGFLIGDYQASKTIILSFDKQGKYEKKIGAIGRGNSEYINVLDFATDRNGDSIIMADVNKLLVYDRNGQYICSKKIDSGHGLPKQVAKTSYGFAFATEFTGGNYQLHILDKKAENVKELIPTNETVTSASNFYLNKMRVDGNRLCYCDYYSSKLYVIDFSHNNNDSVTVCYHFADKGMLSLDKLRDDFVGEEESIDHIEGFLFDHNQIISTIMYHDYTSEQFKINTETHEVYRIRYDEWMPNIYDYCNGYYYALLDQNAVLDVVEGRMYDGSYLADKIIEKYNKLNEKLNEKSNYVILKMKLNEKYR